MNFHTMGKWAETTGPLMVIFSSIIFSLDVFGNNISLTLPIIFFTGCERVQHGEDGKYMWITGSDDSVFDKQSQADRITSERLNTLLTNFVKYLYVETF